ncbi:ATP-dependent DNA helicase Q4 isoform X2 [Corythoichthys intestinalis]|uniref:ATP-dependent DNA helicase Q4 isoform X2 n=1 Tax=Corythoichthys intestinalis TaxID=161448 RepID=UPI0025A618A3|nr:ATP-dependent DNA helicase Q4 isoform X2 [Corythoichthys intestinalis]
MDRYNEVKLLLKSWEQGFVKEHNRKPAKEDIDDAPEETKNLYKEYRSLKLAKENNSSSDSATRNNTEQSGSAPQKDCWGSHLNRSALPASSSRPLTSQDRDALKASAQYYGLKLKTNLVSLSKNNKTVSLKRTGRVPLNSLKRDDECVLENNVVAISHDAESRTFSSRSVKPKLGANKIHLAEPDEPLDQFTSIPEPSKDSLIPSKTHLSPISSGDVEKDSRFTRGGLRPANLGGFQVTSTAGRPTPANRLSCVDRKWLERCQVFGELGAEDKPGAGNQDGCQTNEKTQENRGDEKDAGTDVCVNPAPNSKKIKELTDEPALSKEANEKTQENRGDEKDAVTDICVNPAPNSQKLKEYTDEPALPKEANESPPKKNRKKRQREGEAIEEGGDRKRGRKKNLENNVKKKENAEEIDGKKKRRRMKAKEDSVVEENKPTKAPKKVPQENLLGEIEEDFNTKRSYHTQSIRARGSKATEGNFVRINLKKKSHVKGYALRGMALRKQLYMQKFQLKGERFGGGGGFLGRGRRGGFRGGHTRQGDTCFKCGGTGHWAVHCKGPVPPPATEQPVEEEEPFELPTLEEVARATGTLQDSHVQEDQEAENNGDEALLNVIRPDYERPAPPPPVEPLYSLTDDGNVHATPDDVFVALRELGYNSFRAGQEEAIMRILSGLSTLVVLSTGMGKSLCYQLPAYLYAKRSNCITLVISPLVSLMDDQLSGLPANLKAACIHSNMTMKQREVAIQKVKAGQVCVLLLSPEALVGGGNSGPGCLPSAQELPPVAFACIDEAHCVSEWSHNFRPCYLRLCKVLRERLGVQCLLGLTATATLSTALDIAQHLDIHDQAGIAVRSAAVPANLHLSVSTDKEKDQALVSLLKGDRFGCLDSVIVYCTRREETARVAALLRTCLQGVLLKENKHVRNSQQVNPVGEKKKELARKKIRKPLKWQAESYHAGLSGSERRRVQNNFMCGQLRIVVATVAFGMGLDKSDVRGIIHYNMPKSFESYVQEIGRAGRDGEPAHCHLFLDPEGMDLHELRRHIYSDTVDYYTVKRLVQKVFPPCKCKQIQKKRQELFQVMLKEDIDDAELLEMMEMRDQENGGDTATHQEVLLSTDDGQKEDDCTAEKVDNQEIGWPMERVCHTHERAVPIQETVESLDITEEGIETLLCYLELHPQRFVELLHPTLSVCKISCYDGPRQLRRITKICPPVAVVLARRRVAGQRVESCDQLEFDVVEVADTMGWQLPLVKRGLRQLQWSTDKSGGRSGIHVEFSSLSFYFRSYGDLNDEELDKVCRFLHQRVQDRERSQLYQLSACFKAFKSVAFNSVSSCVDDLDDGRSLQLKGLLSDYFDKRRDRDLNLDPLDMDDSLDKYKLLDWENQIRADIRSFLSHRSDEKFSGRAVARIFHGIGSPCYPAQTYGRDRRYWRKYIQFDFNQLIKMATQEIIQFK